MQSRLCTNITNNLIIQLSISHFQLLSNQKVANVILVGNVKYWAWIWKLVYDIITNILIIQLSIPHTIYFTQIY